MARPSVNMLMVARRLSVRRIRLRVFGIYLRAVLCADPLIKSFLDPQSDTLLAMAMVVSGKLLKAEGLLEDDEDAERTADELALRGLWTCPSAVTPAVREGGLPELLV